MGPLYIPLVVTLPLQSICSSPYGTTTVNLNETWFFQEAFGKDIWAHLWLSWLKALLLAPSGWRLGLPLNILQCAGQTHTTRDDLVQNISIVTVDKSCPALGTLNSSLPLNLWPCNYHLRDAVPSTVLNIWFHFMTWSTLSLCICCSLCWNAFSLLSVAHSF